MGNLIAPASNPRIREAKLQIWGDPDFNPNRGSQLQSNYKMCIINDNQRPGQVGIPNAGYFGNTIAGSGSTTLVGVNPNAYKLMTQRSKCC